MNSLDDTKNLSALFKKANDLDLKILSVEVFSSTLNIDELNKLPKTFSSLVWLYNGSDLGCFENSEPFQTLQKLSVSNEHILFHLPCRNLMENNVIQILKKLQELKIHNLLVLQGDILANRDKRDFEHGVDLVKYIRRNYGKQFTIGVAAYPDVHPEATSAELDFIHLKEKVKAGTDFVITQMVFDYRTFDNFYRNFKTNCPDTPLLLGVYIISSYDSYNLAKRLLQKDLPKNVTDFVIKNKNNEDAILDFGIQLCADLIKRVLRDCDKQIAGIHFFSLNKFQLVKRVCDIVGLSEEYTEKLPNMIPISFFSKNNKGS